ncbi:MAG: hypothetical protein ABIG96_03630 [Candidatus Micrarchaeota archaeon]
MGIMEALEDFLDILLGRRRNKREKRIQQKMSEYDKAAGYAKNMGLDDIAGLADQRKREYLEAEDPSKMQLRTGKRYPWGKKDFW